MGPGMGWFSAPGYWLSRLVFERALGVIYLVAFLVAVNQLRPLVGEHGLLPAPRFLRLVSFRQSPSLFHWRYSDRFLVLVAGLGIVLSASVVVGLASAAPLPVTMGVWLVLWALYLSIMNVGRTFYGFGWESQLCETGFLCVFLCPLLDGRPFPCRSPPRLAIGLLRWLIVRIMLGHGRFTTRKPP